MRLTWRQLFEYAGNDPSHVTEGSKPSLPDSKRCRFDRHGVCATYGPLHFSAKIEPQNTGQDGPTGGLLLVDCKHF